MCCLLQWQVRPQALNNVVFTLLLDVKLLCGGPTAELTQLVNVYHVPDLMVLSNALAQYKQRVVISISCAAEVCMHDTLILYCNHPQHRCLRTA